MKKILALLCGLLGIVLAGQTIPRQVEGQAVISTEKLVAAMRTLNTVEYSYIAENGRFADGDQMLAYLRQHGFLGNKLSPIDFENPQPYELAIAASWNGQHYQISLRPSDMTDKTMWCRPSVFSDDKGVIYLGYMLGCEELSRKF